MVLCGTVVVMLQYCCSAVEVLCTLQYSCAPSSPTIHPSLLSHLCGLIDSSSVSRSSGSGGSGGSAGSCSGSGRCSCSCSDSGSGSGKCGGGTGSAKDGDRRRSIQESVAVTSVVVAAVVVGDSQGFSYYSNHTCFWDRSISIT